MLPDGPSQKSYAKRSRAEGEEGGQVSLVAVCVVDRSRGHTDSNSHRFQLSSRDMTCMVYSASPPRKYSVLPAH